MQGKIVKDGKQFKKRYQKKGGKNQEKRDSVVERINYNIRKLCDEEAKDSRSK